MNNKKNFIVIIALIIFLTFVFGAIHVITMFDVALVQEPKREYQLSGLNTTFTVNLTELKPVSSDYTPFSEYANINKKYRAFFDENFIYFLKDIEVDNKDKSLRKVGNCFNLYKIYNAFFDPSEDKKKWIIKLL